MAGSYPDVPGYRFAYDMDGTSVVYWRTALSSYLSPNSSQLRTINDANPIVGWGGLGGDGHLILLFPEIRSISGILLNYSRNNPIGALQWSSDTSNGIDGAWTTIAAWTSPLVTSNNADLRNLITAVSVPAVTALRFYNMGGYAGPAILNLHIYGSIPTTSSPDRLRIVDISNNDIAAQLDFGDIRQRNNITKQFKVVNNSTTQTANNITVTFDVPYDATPTLVGQYQLSTNNTTFANAINIGTLAPGASSATLYLRDTVSSSANLGLWSLRLVASANTWS